MCSAVSDSHKTVYELLTPDLQELVINAPRGCRLHTVGRLDCDTSGLLLLTNDGKVSHRITASVISAESTSVISKTYCANLKNPVAEDLQNSYIQRAALGLTLPPEKKIGEQLALPAILEFESSYICKVTVHEGKFHEVRRIFRALGNEVTALERIAIGKLSLQKDLEPGQWRQLTDNEKELLMIF